MILASKTTSDYLFENKKYSKTQDIISALAMACSMWVIFCFIINLKNDKNRKVSIIECAVASISMITNLSHLSLIFKKNINLSGKKFIIYMMIAILGIIANFYIQFSNKPLEKLVLEPANKYFTACMIMISSLTLAILQNLEYWGEPNANFNVNPEE